MWSLLHMRFLGQAAYHHVNRQPAEHWIDKRLSRGSALPRNRPRRWDHQTTGIISPGPAVFVKIKGGSAEAEKIQHLPGASGPDGADLLNVPRGARAAAPARAWRVQLRAALRPKIEIVGRRDAAPSWSAVERARSHRDGIALQQAEHGRDRAVGGLKAPVLVEECRMRLNQAPTLPRRLVTRGCVIGGEEGLNEYALMEPA